MKSRVRPLGFFRNQEPSSSAVISDCGKYRYLLKRKIRAGHTWRAVLFIMLNPSTADEHENDPTIRKCMYYAERWGFDELVVANLFALRSPEPSYLYTSPHDPIGPDNKEHLENAVYDVVKRYSPFKISGIRDGIVVCGWGKDGNYMDQGETVLGWLENIPVRPYFLQKNLDGTPTHPLYLKKSLEPKLWTPWDSDDITEYDDSCYGSEDE